MKRPWEITFLGCGFIFVGVVSGVTHARHAQFDRWLVAIELVQVWAIVGGASLLLGRSWSRWVLLPWLAFHVVVGSLHSISMGVSHGVLAAVIAYFLVKAPASEYLRQPAR